MGSSPGGPTGTLIISVYRRHVAGQVTGHIALRGGRDGGSSVSRTDRFRDNVYSPPVGTYRIDAAADGSGHCPSATVRLRQGPHLHVTIICD